MTDQVNHPKHYCSHPSGVECIDITRHMNFNLGNATKYIWRASLKGKQIEDLRKAIWYIEDEIERLQVDSLADDIEQRMKGDPEIMRIIRAGVVSSEDFKQVRE